MRSERKGGGYYVTHGALLFIVAPAEDGDEWTLTPQTPAALAALALDGDRGEERHPRKRDAMARIRALTTNG